MRTAFVLSGGANLGAAQAGMLAALHEAGVVPDVVVGSSVGAVNGAWVAGQQDLRRLGAVWRSLRRGDVFPTRPVSGLLGFLGARHHLVSDSGLRQLLRTYLRFERLEHAPVPLHVVATDVMTGEDVLLSTGDAVEAILASSAIPGVLPPRAHRRQDLDRRRGGQQHPDLPRRRSRGRHRMGAGHGVLVRA